MILLLFMSLLRASIVKNSGILPEIYFIFLRKRPRRNLKVFQYYILTLVKRSVKRSKKQLSSKTRSITFLQANCSKFWLKLQFKRVAKIRVTNKLSDKLSLKEPVASQKQKNVSRGNHEQNIHVKQHNTGKAQFLFFRRFLLVLIKFSFLNEDWALGYNSIKF